MILREVHFIEHGRHKGVQIYGLFGCLQVGHQDRVKNQLPFSEGEQSAQELFGGRERGHIDFSWASL